METITTPVEAAPATVESASLIGNAAAPAPVIPATPAAAPSYVNADGSFAPGWMDSLPDDLKGNAALTTVPTLADLAKSYVHTKTLVGKKLQAPSESSTPEEVAAWRKTVGAPETPEGYGELRPEDFPADQWDSATAGELAKIAHKHHLPASAVKDIIALHAGSVRTGLEKYQADEAAYKQAGIDTLKKEWGADFEHQAHTAATFAKMLGLDPGSTPDFASPQFVLAMAKGAKMILGDKMVAAPSPTLSGSIETRIRDIQNSPEYRGELGQQAQENAQATLHSLFNAKSAA